MSLATWRSPLARALHRNRSEPHSRYFQLATLRPDGLPANRTIVFRGFLNDTNQLIVITDGRSDKIAHVTYQPWAEACWYFTKTREQFRLFGRLQLIDDSHRDTLYIATRQQIWQKLSDKARSQFYWPTPGALRTDNQPFETSAVDGIQPPSCFCLLLIDPTQVDHLELKGNPQNRYRHHIQKDNLWCKVNINP